MSLLLENALSAFRPEEAALVPADALSDDGALDAPLAVEIVAGYADHHDDLRHPDADDWIRLPLHETDSAELTGEYVVYRDHDLRGPLFGAAGEDGGVEWSAAEALADSSLAARLRFWHPDHVPDGMPSYHESPVGLTEPARNPLSSVDELLDGLREFVAEERAVEREANRERADRAAPTDLYRRGHDVIPALRCDGADDGAYVFRVLDAPEVGLEVDADEVNRRRYVPDEFGVHEGNEVLIHAPDGAATEDFPVRATVESVSGTELRLAVDWDEVESRTAVGGVLGRPREDYAVSGLLNPVPYDRQREAIDELGSREGLGAVLAGQEPLTFDDSAKAASEPLDDELNQDQRMAVDHALLADRLFCVHGPPGTGKTRTLVEFVRRSVQAGRDVLVCADSNQAVDNLLVGASTDERADPGSLHAYGQHGTGELVLDRRNVRRSSSSLVRSCYGGSDAGRPDVVATTNSSAARLAREFDVAVVDEATQATCAASCVPLARAEKVVLAGDHRQLPPYSATDDPAASSYGLSLFEHLYAEGGAYEGVGVQLRTQYRMHRDVSYFPNRAFYDRSLRNGRRVDPLADRPPVVAHSLGGPERRDDHSWYNPTEATLVGLLVKDLLDDGLAPDEIGVITPYQAQVDAVGDRLSSVSGGDAVTVDTIDAFQGSEREAIVISFVRSNDDGTVGFLGRPEDGLRRLNVALTRAKRHCALVGDWNTLRGHLRETPTHGCVETYRDLYDYLADTGRVAEPDPALLPAL